jgi:hypothetical protein
LAEGVALAPVGRVGVSRNIAAATSTSTAASSTTTRVATATTAAGIAATAALLRPNA